MPMPIAGTHDWMLVAMSALIAAAASFTALDLAGRVQVSDGWTRRAWLATAAVAMGGGIWAMHFVGMLAWSMPGVPVAYDLPLTVGSLGIAVLATGVGFVVLGRAGRGWMLVPAGLCMGAGIVAMHYMGMAAMRMPADLSYDRRWVAGSVLIAIGAATAALWLAARGGALAERIVAALVMGGAVAGMHYAGMAAARFRSHPGAGLARGTASLGQASLALDVGLATLLILFLALVAAMFDRRFASLAEREAARLRDSEERFRSLYRGTPLPLHSLDGEGHIEQVSDAWCELTGYPREEVIGRPLVDFLTEASARAATGEDRARLSAAGAIRDREYRIVTKRGEVRDVLLSARLERNATGAVQVLGGLADVTDRHRAEEALRQAQKIEAIGQLTGGVAHDFNNLLAVVVGNLDLLRKRVPDSDPKARRLLESAMEGAQRGAAMTQRLLAFARRQDLQPEAVDVSHLVRGMADLLQRSLGPMVKVETRFPPSLPPVRVDANQLEMALLNVAVNARDAMPEGGTLAIAAAGELVAEGLGLAPGAYIKLSLADTGEGMDAATLARATEPFFTTKGVGKGTGLGLSMVQGLAAQSGGRLVVKSRLGQGTVVELLLPVAEMREPAARAPTPASAPVHTPARRILAVDDDPLVLANTIAMLDDLGHEVMPAVSGADALDQLADGLAVDMVITDQLMPGMTGTQLAARIARDHAGPAILLVSGFAELAPGAAGDLPMLRKPFDQAALAAAVAALEVGRAVPIRQAG